MSFTKPEKIGQFFSPAAFIHDGESEIRKLESLIRNQHVGGITFFHSRHSAAANFEHRQEELNTESTYDKLLLLIDRYQKAAKIPLLISIDAEYGLAMRVENTPRYPFAISLGALSPDYIDYLFKMGFMIGEDLKGSGIHLNLAPVADVNTNPDNPVIGYRSFGSDREKVSQYALAVYQGMKASGIAACYKHFPGHGDTHVDSHLGLPVIEKSRTALMEEELYPFIAGINAGVEMIMAGHLAAPSLSDGKTVPASLSHEIITGLLKQELGFKGIVISDALNMKSVTALFPEPGRLEWEAFHAGNDILCFSEHIEEGIAWIADKAPDERIEESFGKIMGLKEKLGIFKNQRPKDFTFNWQGVNKLNRELAEKYLTVVKSQDNLTDTLDKAGKAGKLAKLSLHGGKDNLFFTKINEHFVSPQFEASKLGEDWAASLGDFDEIVVALFVPSAKPVNRFGLDHNLIKKLVGLTKAKNCHLYLFGNPLALREIENNAQFKTITVAFQDFEFNQITAAVHLRGKLKALGETESIKVQINQ